MAHARRAVSRDRRLPDVLRSDYVGAMRRFPLSRLPLFSLVLLTLVAACDCKGTTSKLGRPCVTADDCDGLVCTDDVCSSPNDATSGDGSVAGDAGDGGDGGGNVGAITSLELSPATVNLQLGLGVADSSTVFTVIAHYQNGSSSPVGGATFATDVQAPGIVDATGRYFANGTIGGTVQVSASLPTSGGTMTANATIEIHLASTAGGGSGNGSPSAIFTSNAPVTATSADAEILYPLDGAVMPQNVQPSDVQWACDANGTPCAAADVFRVRITKPHMTITQFVTNDGNQGDGSVDDHFIVGEAAWRALAQTDPDAAASIVVDRWQAAQSRVVSGTPVEIVFAKAAITGTVYYWDIDDMTIRAIDDGTSSSRVLLPHIDSPSTGSGDSCVGCHSISPSGRYMLANTNFDNYGALFDLTRANLSTTNPTQYDSFTPTTSIRWRLSSWSPDETRAMVSTAIGNDALALIDPFTGQTVQARNAAGANLSLPDPATMPAWARDDANVAFIAGNNGWAGDTTTGNLRLLPVVDSAMDRFGAVVNLLDSSALNGAPEVGSAGTHGIFYPSWSPDSTYLAFAHGTSSRSDPRDADDAWNAGTYAPTSSLYLMNRNGNGRVRLSRGCAASVPEKDPGMAPGGSAGRTGLDFQPNFSPFQGGGYYWLSFLSRRPYGNTLTGNRGTAIQPGQIWVMAIHVQPDGSVDPSEVAYWLPGQDPDHRAVSAFWAPRPCRGNGEGCSVGSECCGGDCRPPVGGGAPVCSPPPPNECRMTGETCSSVADCCRWDVDPRVQCTGNVCVELLE